MATNSVQVQLQKAIEMRGQVIEFAKRLNDRMQQLSDMLEQSVRAGFPEDIASTYYVNYYTPDREIINDLISKMLNDHVNFLDNVISYLTSADSRR